MPELSQGSSVSWGGAIQSLIGINISPRTADIADVTTMSAGTSSGGLVVRQKDCFSVDPGEATVRFFGCGFNIDSVGAKASFSASVGGVSISGQAILESFEVEAAVGELVRGSAKFRFTGA